MALNKILIGWKNVLTQMTLTSSLPAEANHPLANVLSQTKGLPARWDMTGETALTLTATSATAFAMTGLILKGHNFGSDTTVRFRIFAGENQSGTVVYDSDDVAGADKIYTIIPWGEMIAGVDPWGNYYDPESNLDRVWSLAFETVTGKSVQLDLTIPTPTNSIAEIDKLALFFAWEPDYNFEYGSPVSIEDASEQNDTVAGGVWGVRRPARRRLDFEFALIQDVYRNRLMALLEERQKGGDMYIIPAPTDTGYSKFLGNSIYRRTNDAGYEHLMFNGSRMALSFREN